MCGISGIYVSEASDSIESIQLMNNLIQHRGPDDEGFVFFDLKKDMYSVFGGKDTPQNVYAANYKYTPNKKYTGYCPMGASLALGHRRLSIIDLSPAGHQPMCSHDERYWIVYNGEIYNYLELREALEREGYRFCSNSDTEVLLNSYIHWGIEALNRLIGMFSFVIFDRKMHELFLARDFYGIKPLYYTYWKDGFAFASEIKALSVLPQVNKTVNPQRAFAYLYGGLTDHGGETLLRQIYQLPAAHYLCIDLNNPVPRSAHRYWDINRDRIDDITFKEASDHLRKLFLGNINLHLRSDVPVGAALSGGIDSSAIVMSMRKLQGNDLDVHTFSYIADDPEICEEDWIDYIGNASFARMHKVKPKAYELLDDLDSLIYYQDEPFGSTSIYAQYRVMRLARECRIKVMIDGQGADEQLAGYNGYAGARLASLIRHYKWATVFRFFLNATQIGFVTKNSLLMQTGRFFLPSRLQTAMKKSFKVNKVTTWLNNPWFKERNVNYAGYRLNNKKNIMRERLYESMTQGGLNSLLRYEDRNSMAFSIESRVPFLTPELTDFLFSLPEEYILDVESTTKSVFRHAMRGIVPEAILDRKDKIGFATPELEWLRELKPWIDDTLSSDIAQSIPIIKFDRFKIELNHILSGRVKFDWCIWRLMNFIKWVEFNNINFD